MLPKLFRLTKEKDFIRAVKKGRRFFLTELEIKIIKNGLKNSRYGIIVSKKINKKSVIRHKIKRQIREIVRQNLFRLKPGFDLLIFTKPKIQNLDFWQIKEKIENLLEKPRLFQEP